MKISWGYKIAAAYLLFVAGMLYLVFRAANERYDLVTEDYYGAELKYQTVIDQKERVARLSVPPKLTISENRLEVVFPAEFTGKQTDGELYLYCPSNEKADLRRPFSITGGAFALSLPRQIKGLYVIKLSWQSGGQTYFLEQKEFFHERP